MPYAVSVHLPSPVFISRPKPISLHNAACGKVASAGCFLVPYTICRTQVGSTSSSRQGINIPFHIIVYGPPAAAATPSIA